MAYHVRQNWESRNSAQHGIDPITRELALYGQAQREITELYNYHHSVLPGDKTLFYATLTIHWEMEPTSNGLRQWLNTWKPVVLQSIQTTIASGTAQNHSIQQYFQPQPTTTPPLTETSNHPTIQPAHIHMHSSIHAASTPVSH